MVLQDTSIHLTNLGIYIVTLMVDFNYVTKISIECLCFIFKYKTSNVVVFLAS